MIRRTAILISLLVIARPAAAQTMTDGRVWFTAFLQGRMSKNSPWRWTFETVLRSRDGLDALDTRTFRPTLIYTLSKHVSAGGGYALVSTFPAAGGVTTEHRAYGVFILTGAAGRGTFTMRVRLEDRYIENNSGPLWRIRPQARISHPVRPGSRFAVVGSDELSLHLNTTTRSPRGVDQNRAFGGLSTTWSSRVRTETGYLNQFIPGHGAANRMNHVAFGTLTISF
jgi:hypothetical protein